MKLYNIFNNSVFYKDVGFYFVVIEYRVVNFEEKFWIKYYNMVCV